MSSPLWENEEPRMRTTDPSVRVRFMGIHKKITAREAGREQKGNDISPSFQNKSKAARLRCFLSCAKIMRINIMQIIWLKSKCRNLKHIFVNLLNTAIKL